MAVSLRRLATVAVATVTALALLPATQTPATGAPPSGTWTTVGPGGGGAFNSPCLTDDAWVVGSDLGGLWRSTDEGTTWTQLGAAAGLTQTHVSSTACLADGRVVVGTEAGIYLVDAAGGTATRATITDGSAPYVAAVASAADHSVLYAVAHPAWDALDPEVLRSTDGGATWAAMTAGGLPRHRRVVALRTHPVDPDAVVAVTGPSRFRPAGTSGPRQTWISTDGGDAFTRLDPDQGPVLDVTYPDPAQPNTLLLTSRTTGLWRSADAGDTWHHVANRTGLVLPSPSGTVRLFDAENAAWGDPAAGVWESTSAGAPGTWTRVSDLGDWSSGWSRHIRWWGVGTSYQGLLQTAAGTADGTTTLWTDSQFVYASSDGARSFHSVTSRRTGPGAWATTGVDNTVATALAPSRARAGLVFVGYQDLGLWRTRDDGASWQALRPRGVTPDWGGGRLGGNTLTVLADPTRPRTVWASFGGDIGIRGNTRLLRSADGGDHWSRVHGLPHQARQISGLALDVGSRPGHRGLSVVVDHEVFRSRDDGRTWSLDFAGCRGCELSWVAGDRTYAGGWGGLWSSRRGGPWTRVSLPGVRWQSAADRTGHFYDSGYRGVSDLAIVSGDLWAAVTGRGFFRSEDGSTWALVSRDRYARSVTRSGQGDIATGSSSAFRSGGWDDAHPSMGVRVSTSGDPGSWVRVDDGLAYPLAVAVRTAADGDLWALSPGQGVVHLG